MPARDYWVSNFAREPPFYIQQWPCCVLYHIFTIAALPGVRFIPNNLTNNQIMRYINVDRNLRNCEWEIRREKGRWKQICSDKDIFFFFSLKKKKKQSGWWGWYKISREGRETSGYEVRCKKISTLWLPQ